jgi:trimethylguanosine synthase
MGKHRGALSGVSRFLQQAFKGEDIPEPESDTRPAKKRKTSENGVAAVKPAPSLPDSQWIEKYDATGLVPHYKHASEVPAHLQKCRTLCALFLAAFLIKFF